MSEEEIKRKKLREKKRKEKEKRIEIMKLSPRYPLDIWRKLRLEKIRLSNCKEIDKIEEIEKLIASLELEIVHPSDYSVK